MLLGLDSRSESDPTRLYPILPPPHWTTYRCGTAAPRDHPQRPHPMLAPPRYSCRTAAPLQHRVVIGSAPIQRSQPPPPGTTYSCRTAAPQQHRVVIHSVPIQRSHPPAGPHTAAEQQLHSSTAWSSTAHSVPLPLDHILLQISSSTAAPRSPAASASIARSPSLDHIQLQKRSSTAAGVVIRSVFIQRSRTPARRDHPQRPHPTLAPPRWTTYRFRTAAPQQRRVVVRSVRIQSSRSRLEHIQLQNSKSTAAPRGHPQRPPAGAHTAAEHLGTRVHRERAKHNT